MRALARDAGARLGVGGHLTSLRRTAVGPYDLAGARTLEQLGEDFALLPIAAAARAAFPAHDLDEQPPVTSGWGAPSTSSWLL